MNLKLASFSAILLSGTLAGLTGYLFGGGEESDSTDVHVESIHNYTLSGDSIFLGRPADTLAWCNRDERKVDFVEASVDTSFFKIEGDTFTLYEPAKEFVDWSGDGPESTGIFIQTYVVYTRISGNSGLEGSWRYADPGYRVTKGTLTSKSKETWDKSMKWDKDYMSFSTLDLKIADGKISEIRKIRPAEQFLATWNGDLFGGEGIAPDSARYDAEVTVVDRNTVKVKGNKNGETVTIDFVKDGSESYTSDKAEHKPYSAAPNPASCPIENWYQEDFLPGNS